MEGMKEWRAVNKPELRGIIPNAMEHIFERVAADSSDETQFLIRCSYLEIYNEEVCVCVCVRMCLSVCLCGLLAT